ncbi:MAG: hypothetical protein HYX31_03875 [Mycobacterium sp.]|jgi:protein-tyrosine phosphatase|nr:hypothetical protein [Mycobacterium sp.]
MEREGAGMTWPHEEIFHRYPIPDNHVIDDAGYDDILARLRSELNSGRTVYLHCWGGRGRTSTVVGCWLIEQGLDYDATIARLKELRCNTRNSHVSVPESRSQHEVLRRRANLFRRKMQPASEIRATDVPNDVRIPTIR